MRAEFSQLVDISLGCVVSLPKLIKGGRDMKKAGDEKRYNQDENGQWWYHGTSKGINYRLRSFPFVCEFCKEEFILANSRKGRRYCSHACSRKAFMVKNPDFFKGEKSGHWRGGRINRRGYVFIHSPDHPACQHNKRKYVAEHRLIMENHLGRYLKPSESVHHKNGVKADNRLENLELWGKSHPNGVRMEDAPHCPTCTCGKH